MAGGGPLKSVEVNGRYFSCAGDADTNRFIGGYKPEFEMNGDLTGREVKTAAPWSVTGGTLTIDDAIGDQEYLQDIADGPVKVPILITYADDAKWQGVGKPGGDLTHASANGVAAVDFSGPGKLTQQ